MFPDVTLLGHGRRTTSMEPQAGHGTLTPGAPGGILTLNEVEQELQDDFSSIESEFWGGSSSITFRSGSSARGGGASGSGSTAGGGASGSGSTAGGGASGSGSTAGGGASGWGSTGVVSSR